MNENDKTFGALMNVFNKLSLQQRMFLGGIVIVMLVLLGFVFLVINEPSYTVLYSNLNSEDAAKVIDHLNSQKIPYQLDAGQTISVPDNQIYEVRISLAGKGIPSSGIIGYEVFDKSNLGMSEFMQKLNFKRALEGEISKTIMQLRGVEQARINIVFPEKSIFKEEQVAPTASVALKLNTGMVFAQNNIAAITHLVSSSVEGLQPENVTIIDSNGRLLTRPNENDGIDAANSKQYEIKGKVETYLAGKAQGMLDKIVGYGNSDVKVNVDIDFKQVDKTMTTYDPDGQVALSEQTVKTENSGISPVDSNLVTTQNSVTNYELSSTIERVIEGSGVIKRITVAAVINGVKQEIQGDNGSETVMQPRPQEQLQQIEQIISRAIGIDANRNDQVSVISMPFENQLFEEVPEEKTPINDLDQLIKYIFAIVGVIAAMIVLKNLLGKLKSEKILIGTFAGAEDEAYADFSAAPSISSGAGGGSLAMPSMSNGMKQALQKKKRELMQVGDIEDEISDEAVLKKMETGKIVNYVQKNPTEAAKLINSWLRDDEY